MQFKSIITLVLCSLLLAGIGPASDDTSQAPAAKSRSFYMGFTAFPYDITLEARETAWDKVAEHADIAALHFDNGVPWQEALDGTPYAPDLQWTIGFQEKNIPDDHVVYLALTPISTLRDDLAWYWTETEENPNAEKWIGRSFRDRQVIKAYINHCRTMIDRFKPDYVAYAIEADLLNARDPEKFDDFLKLARKTYRKLKRAYPDITIFATVTAGPDAQEERRLDGARRILKYSDMVAVSTYPYLDLDNEGNPRNIDKDWLQQVQDLAPDKPFAITETAYIAEDLVFESFGLTIEGRERWQKKYLRILLKACEELEAEFVIWWLTIDYDRLWEFMEAQGVAEIFKAWQDSGMFDENLDQRKALKLWNKWLKRERQ